MRLATLRTYIPAPGKIDKGLLVVHPTQNSPRQLIYASHREEERAMLALVGVVAASRGAVRACSVLGKNAGSHIHSHPRRVANDSTAYTDSRSRCLAADAVDTGRAFFS